ncbi:MAG: hypothetical protein IH873_10585, partial [Chloroflexi bacterium]|nr:hypothetical protein [Chloroflexota bacterium]
MALILAVGAACATSSSHNSESEAAIEDLPEDFQRLAEVWRLLQREHIDGNDLISKDISDGAIQGMLAALDDPYAAYLTPDQFSID